MSFKEGDKVKLKLDFSESWQNDLKKLSNSIVTIDKYMGEGYYVIAEDNKGYNLHESELELFSICGNCKYFNQNENDDNGGCELEGGRTSFGYYCRLHTECDKKANSSEKEINQPSEKVNHPSHYNKGKYEVIDVIEDWNLGFSLGNAIKYIARAKHKGKYLEDLKKAIFYLQREVERVIANDEL